MCQLLLLLSVKSVRELMMLGSKEPSASQNFLFYCTYCSTHCNNQQSLDDHCQTSEHVFNVVSDKQHQWNYRSPPWTTNGHFSLCLLSVSCIVCSCCNSVFFAVNVIKNEVKRQMFWGHCLSHFYVFITWQCRQRHCVFRFSLCSVRPLVRSDIATTSGENRLFMMNRIFAPKLPID